MTKIINVYLNYYQISIYYNIYVLTSVYFGYGITKLDDKEEAELMKIYEVLILKKLGLSIKFLQAIMHILKESLGLEFVKPKTIIVI